MSISAPGPPFLSELPLSQRVGPAKNIGLAGRLCGEISRLGGDSNATKIETVRVPAGSDRGIERDLAIGMVNAGDSDEVERVVIDFEVESPELLGKDRAAPTVLGVGVFAPALRVVEEGEEPDDVRGGTGLGREARSDGLDPPPVVGSVERSNGKGKPVRDGAP